MSILDFYKNIIPNFYHFDNILIESVKFNQFINDYRYYIKENIIVTSFYISPLLLLIKDNGEIVTRPKNDDENFYQSYNYEKGFFSIDYLPKLSNRISRYDLKIPNIYHLYLYHEYITGLTYDRSGISNELCLCNDKYFLLDTCTDEENFTDISDFKEMKLCFNLQLVYEVENV